MTSPSSTAGARLRRTFHYLADDNDNTSDSDPEFMDEEEQAHLVTTLATRNKSQNAFYQNLLLVIPLLAAVPHLASFVSARAPISPHRTILSLSSLGATALQVWMLPPQSTGIVRLDEWASPPAERSVSSRKQRTAPAPAAAWWGEHLLGSPLRSHLPILNLVLSLLLALPALFFPLLSSSSLSEDHPDFQTKTEKLYLSLLPLFAYLVVTAAKIVMAGVDPEAELEGLKYGYKGA